MSVYEVAGPAWLYEGDDSYCEQCGHSSGFEAGFQYHEGKFISGWYNDYISCYGGYTYYGDDDGNHSLESFREFLKGVDQEEAVSLLRALEERIENV